MRTRIFASLSCTLCSLVLAAAAFPAGAMAKGVHHRSHGAVATQASGREPLCIDPGSFFDQGSCGGGIGTGAGSFIAGLMVPQYTSSLLYRMGKYGTPVSLRNEVVADLELAKREGGKEIYDWAKEARRDQAKAAALLCVFTSAIAVGVEVLWQILVDHRLNLYNILKAGFIACGAAVGDAYKYHILTKLGFRLTGS